MGGENKGSRRDKIKLSSTDSYFSLKNSTAVIPYSFMASSLIDRILYSFLDVPIIFVYIFHIQENLNKNL